MGSEKGNVERDGSLKKVGNGSGESAKKRLSFLEMHSSNNPGTDSQTSDTETESDTNSDLPQICGKIGKRASRFSIYLGKNQIPRSPTHLKANKSPYQIEEVSESRTSVTESGSTRSIFGKKTRRTSSCSETHLPTSGYDSGVAQEQATPHCLSDDDGLCDSGKLARSKYQERLLNRALQSGSKYSLDMSGGLKLSNSKHVGHDSVVETGFAKQQNATNKSQVGFINRVSIENQLSMFRPASPHRSAEMRQQASPVAKIVNQGGQPVKNSPDEVGAQFQGIKIPSNIFSKKADHDNSYRDSCDVNLENKRSVIKFYEHWKLTNNKQKEIGPSTGFNRFNMKNPQTTTENSESSEAIRGVKDSLCSRDSNFFDIFGSNRHSLSSRGRTGSEKQSPESRKRRSTRNSPQSQTYSIKSGTDTIQTQLEKSTENDPETSTNSNSQSLFRMLSENSKNLKSPNNLLSEMLTQTNQKSKADTEFTEMTNRDSLFDQPVDFLPKLKDSLSRNSAHYNNEHLRDSHLVVDESVKKKFSVMDSQISTRRNTRINPKNKRGESAETDWNDSATDAKLVGMLSLTSQIEEHCRTRQSRKSGSGGNALPNSTLSGNRTESDLQSNSGISTLFIKKPTGKLIKLKSNLVTSQTTSPVKAGESQINDNMNLIFDVSREPGEFLDLLSIGQTTQLISEMSSHQSESQQTLSPKSKKIASRKRDKKRSKNVFEVISNFFKCRGCKTRFTI